MNILIDLPISLGAALGVSGAADQAYIGGLILSSLIIFGTIIALNATKKVQLPGHLFGVLIMSGVCVAVNWLDEGIFIVGLVLIAVFAMGKLKNIF